jgi:hypothetical protein
MKKYERTTACIRNSGFSAKSKVCTFNKLLRQTESEVLLNPLLRLYSTVGRQPEKTKRKQIT